MVHLQRIDPTQNMARYYRVDVMPTLFGETSVMRTWGRIGTSGRSALETCADENVAVQVAAKAVQRKVKRGYSAVPAIASAIAAQG